MQTLLVLFVSFSMTMAQTCKLPPSYEQLYDRALKGEVHDEKRNLVSVLLKCPEGEILVPTVRGKERRSLNATCHNGKWEPDFSNYTTCESIRCQRPNDTYCYTATWSDMEPSPRGPEINHEVRFEAKRGYEIKPKAIMCVNDTEFTARLNGSLPTCKSKTIRCPRPKDTYCYTVKWMQMETSPRGPEIGHEVRFEAKRGYEISEPKAIMCVKVTDFKARLNGRRPACKILHTVCKKPKIRNGYVLSTNDEDFGSDEFLSIGDYKVRCMKGYRLRKGSNRRFSCAGKRRIRFARGKRPKCVVDKAKNRTKLPN